MFVSLIAALSLLPAIAASSSVSDLACSSLVLETDKDSYLVGESVNITVHFSPILPGCLEPMIAHDYVLTIQILNDAHNVVYSSSNATPVGIVFHESWIPVARGEYTLNATSWWRLMGDDLMMKQLETLRIIHVQGPNQCMMSELEWIGLENPHSRTHRCFQPE